MGRLTVAVLLTVLAVTPGCRKSAQPDYFPLVPGAQKLMRISTRHVAAAETSETTEVRLVSVVLGQKRLPEVGNVWVVETPRDSGPSNFSYFRKTPDAVVQLVPRRGKTPLTLLYLSLPLEKGKHWYDTEAQHERLEVVARETLRVEAGEFPDCYKVAVIRVDTDVAMHQWFAPGIGPVKWESRSVWEQDGVRHEQYRVAELVGYREPE